MVFRAALPSAVGKGPTVFFRDCQLDGAIVEPVVLRVADVFLHLVQDVQLGIDGADLFIRQHGPVRDELAVADALLVFRKEFRKSVQRNIQLHAQLDGLHELDLGEIVIAVPCFPVHMGRRQNTYFVVVTEGFDVDPGLFGDVSDGQQMFFVHVWQK